MSGKRRSALAILRILLLTIEYRNLYDLFISICQCLESRTILEPHGRWRSRGFDLELFVRFSVLRALGRRSTAAPRLAIRDTGAGGGVHGSRCRWFTRPGDQASDTFCCGAPSDCSGNGLVPPASAGQVREIPRHAVPTRPPFRSSGPAQVEDEILVALEQAPGVDQGIRPMPQLPVRNLVSVGHPLSACPALPPTRGREGSRLQAVAAPFPDGR